MKKLLILLILPMIAGINAFGQSPLDARAGINISMVQNETPEALWKWNDEYSEKARKQKIAAWVLAGAGAGMIIAGIIVGTGESDDLTDAIGDSINGGALIAVGTVVAVASVPLFIISGKNKRKSGVSGSINVQNASFASNPQLSVYPAAGLKIKF